MKTQQKIGFGGGCHWCTEAVFQSLKGVDSVEQGWIAAKGKNVAFSEAVIVNFDACIISTEILVEIHLHTHKSTSQHSMREKYRSAVYIFNEDEEHKIKSVLNTLQEKFDGKLITQVLRFLEFRPSREQITNYYYKNPLKPFCETFINPKLQLLTKNFSDFVNNNLLQLS